MTERELGELWDKNPETGDINTYAKEMPNYEEPTVGKDKSDEEYDAHCWNCKSIDEETGKKIGTPISSEECEKCPECNYAYKCGSCGLCECARPNSKIREQMEKWANRKGTF